MVGFDPDYASRAVEEMGAYFLELAASRRQDPRDDLISELVAVDEDRAVSESIRVLAEKYSDCELLFANGGDRSSGKVVPETAVCEEFGIDMVFDMGGNEKADSSSRINMELGVETEASALPSENS